MAEMIVMQPEILRQVKVFAESGVDLIRRVEAAPEAMRELERGLGIATLKENMSAEVVIALRALQNTAIGFKTDKQRDGYADNVLVACACMALGDGLSLTGNQWNIISGQYFVAKDGWRAKLKKLGAVRISVEAGMPEEEEAGPQNQNGACRFSAKFSGRASCAIGQHTYQIESRKGEWLDTRLLLSSYTRELSDAADQMRGKAEARLLKKLYYFASGEAYVPDGEELAAVEVVEPARITEAPAPPEPQTQTGLAESHRLAFENQANCISRVLQKVPDAKRAAIEACIDAIRAADDAGRLAEQWPEILGVLDGNNIKPGGVDEVEKLYQMRLTILRGDL
jgi:hypothetical protein